MADIRGIGPSGNPVEVSVTEKGEVFEAVHSYSTGLLHISGIGTAAAYASGDAFGTQGVIPVPREGTIAAVFFLDYDKEGLNKEIVLFSTTFTATADNAVFDISDDELHSFVGLIPVSTWFSFNSNQVGVAYPALTYVAPAGNLYYQIVTRGADNIAVGAIPDFFMVIV